MIRTARRRFFTVTLAALGALAVSLVSPGTAEAGSQVFQSGGLLGKSYAISGYDTVAYHTQRQAVEGSDSFTHDWNGATWKFASAENRALFVAEPEKYAPAYGGYCAFAVAQGATASTDPEAWDVVDGRLYLNYNKGIQKRWQSDRPGFIKKAEANWPKIRAGLQ